MSIMKQIDTDCYKALTMSKWEKDREITQFVLF